MGEQTGLIVLYRWQIAPEHLDAFRSCWAEATERLRAHGALGSLLARAEDGTVWAIARWPDAKTRAAAERDYVDTADWPPVRRLEIVLLAPIENRWTP